MSRHGKNSSYGHSITRIGYDHYRLGWTVDRYQKGSRLRFPTRSNRDTDGIGASRFAKRWNLDFKPVPGET